MEGKLDEAEVFATTDDGVNFRNVGWIRAAMMFLKMTFATGVLSLPTALYQTGAVPGAICILFFGLLNTYMAVIQGQFKLAHPSVHTVVDSIYLVTLQMTGGSRRTAVILREIGEVLYTTSWILCAGLAIMGMSIALNSITHHGTCSVVFGFCSFLIVSAVASIRKIERLGWVAWVGFGSLVVAILTVVIATALRDRPASAPQTGEFEIGFSAFPAPTATFASAFQAALMIFTSSSNTSGYVPVISEMRKPNDYFKSVYACMAWIITSYMTIGLVMFRFAGKWLSTPALGSAGPTIKVVSYSIALPGLIATAAICLHVAAKSLFVRFMRGSHHLTANTWQHWVIWIAITFCGGLAAWLCAEAIPFFGSLLSVIGCLGFGPLGLCLPPILWFCMNKEARTGNYKMRLLWWLHVVLLCIGLFVVFGGLYATVVVINGQFRSGNLGASFQCADNSNTIASSQ